MAAAQTLSSVEEEEADRICDLLYDVQQARFQRGREHPEAPYTDVTQLAVDVVKLRRERLAQSASNPSSPQGSDGYESEGDSQREPPFLPLRSFGFAPLTGRFQQPACLRLASPHTQRQRRCAWDRAPFVSTCRNSCCGGVTHRCH